MSADSNKRIRKTPLMQELEEMYKDLQIAISGAKFFGKSLAPALQPLERIVLFVAKIVQELEQAKERIAWLEQELNKADASKRRAGSEENKNYF